jgi:tRNA pseudouridine38-40 synthase
VDSSADAGRIRLRLDLSYDGTDFSGWASQPARRTVAGTLTDALQVLLRHPVQLVVAGRTDAGVHASGQVAHVDVAPDALRALAPRHTTRAAGDRANPLDRTSDATRDTPAGDYPAGDYPAGDHPAGDYPADGQNGAAATAQDPPGEPLRVVPAVAEAEPLGDSLEGRSGLLRRLAGLLAPDLRVREITLAPTGFDARFAALRRHYRYRIGTAEWGVEPPDRLYVLARRRAMDTEAMSRAAAALIGLHDFAAFCRPREGATTTRELQSLTVTRLGHEIHIDVVADAFCHSMVRALVGSLMAVGEGRDPIDRPSQLLASGLRTSGIHVAPAHGLILRAVDYPPDDELARRAEQTRARRP